MSRHLLTLLGSLVVVSGLTVVACGDDETGTGGTGGVGGGGGDGGTTTTSSTGGSGGTPMCASDQFEVPLAPAGWVLSFIAEGPIDAAPECATPSIDVYSGLQGTPTVGCTCACSAPLPSNCGASLDNWDSDATCSDAVDTTQTFASGDCVMPGNVGPGGSWRWQQTAAPAVLCDVAPAADLSALSWDYSARLCEAPTETVSGKLCATIPDEFSAADFCIYSNGDVACPANYPNKQVADSQLNDTRGCSSDNCTCGTGDAACAGSMTFYVAAACNDQNGTLPVDESTCETPAAAHLSVGWEAAPTGTCSAAGTTAPMGDVTTEQPVTICCVN